MGSMLDADLRRRKKKALLTWMTVYLVFVGSIFTSRTIIETTRIDISDLDLSGKTVAQAEGIIKSEGYSPIDYLVITDDGNPAAPVWTVDRVEEGRKARVFVSTGEIPDIDSLNIVGTTLNHAKKKMSDVGMIENRDFSLKHENGKSTSMLTSTGLKVLGIDDSKGIPLIIVENPQKSSTDSSQLQDGESLDKSIGKMIGELFLSE